MNETKNYYHNNAQAFFDDTVNADISEQYDRCTNEKLSIFHQTSVGATKEKYTVSIFAKKSNNIFSRTYNLIRNNPKN